MSDQQNKFSELRSCCKYYIDAYITLYQLKTGNEVELNSIYRMIKTELLESKKYLPQNIIRDILDIIPFNNRYTKTYLSLSKLISDEYHVKNVKNVEDISNFLFYKEYGIQLDKSTNFEEDSKDLDVHAENTVYRAIMDNDKERFISFTEREGFNKGQILKSNLYPNSEEGYSLLELCCYHGSVDCFKFLRTKFDSKITEKCLELSFLGRNQEILNECLKYQQPNDDCIKYAIISHNIDFVTFLMNEHNIEIDLEDCYNYNNLEAFMVYLDQIDFKKCLVLSAMFKVPSLCEYLLSHGANIDEKDIYGDTALHKAAFYNSKETVEILILHGANIDEKDLHGKTALHKAAFYNSKETAELLISLGANINEKEKFGKTALHMTANNNSIEVAELLISYGANVDEKDKFGKTALHMAAENKSKETAELLISHGANINEKDKFGKTALHMAAENKSQEIAELLISHGANINEKDLHGKTALHKATIYNSRRITKLLISHGANINEK
ncbi:hypothetical protein TVAG_150200 [Trichomonas vaginalis G3]|uniref:DUF3447 domain-containing protein n=1 Tax=Trichomonas vaginalis (strain ATCC PRA-98 / G3) TaxID=412133 RepID=A2DRS2_TRIV3|nr:ankyrin repeat and SOCS box-containing protein 4 family [Trichomonas vaginalis G3]EAY16869.1 hypothetical protein TVAG_150200 [Trichomonas vaginalis G3]KAI5489144.1 ankyrin repeat and SOCS box-containing protein 4 family [Trichomonas vaginalis G3]|eukprot:XP_001329092.1 hypothetical protein [Trichomonas vaginalis G3]